MDQEGVGERLKRWGAGRKVQSTVKRCRILTEQVHAPRFQDRF